MQGNLNRSRAADFLLDQIIREIKPSVVFLSEQYRHLDSSYYFEDESGTTALLIPEAGSVQVDSHGSGEGHVFVTSGNLTYVSCYLSPNEGIMRYRGKLEMLEDALRNIVGSFIVVGDFNARALEWGMPHTDTRGRVLCEMVSRLSLLVLNVGNTPTFRRPGFGESIPDVTLASEDLATRIEGWRVMGDYTGSEYEYITFQLEDNTANITPSSYRPVGWHLKRMNTARLQEVLRVGFQNIHLVKQQRPGRTEAEAAVESTLEVIRQACDAAIPRKKSWYGKCQVYWWTDEIAGLRRNYLRLRRKAQRIRRRRDANVWSERHKTAKKG